MQIFNNGWGGSNPILAYQQRLIQDLDADVLIHSTWYTDEYHTKVSEWLDQNPVKTMIILSFFDQHIANKEMFADRNITIREIGYYPGADFFDFWARFTQEHMVVPSTDELLDHKLIVHPFLSYNRKPHPHRLELYNQLVDQGIVDRGIVTMDNIKQLAEDVDIVDWAPSGGSSIKNDIASLGRIDVWNSCLLNIVTETFDDINRAYFVSEKIYKPIVGCRPFFVYAEDLGHKWLTDRGFVTFEQDFTDIYDKVITKDNLVEFLVILSNQSTEWLQSKFLALQSKLLYNKQRFDDYVRENEIRSN